MIIIRCSSEKLRKKLLQEFAHLTLENAIEYERIDKATERNAEILVGARASDVAFSQRMVVGICEVRTKSLKGTALTARNAHHVRVITRTSKMVVNKVENSGAKRGESKSGSDWRRRTQVLLWWQAQIS